MFKKTEIWVPYKENTIKLYNCFQSIKTNMYHVQNCDHLDCPIDGDVHRQQQEICIELFLDELPNERIKGYKTISEAIEAFEKDFD